MTTLSLIRHGPTEWTEAKRLQGRTDVPLSGAGRRAVAGWRLPDDVRRAQWLSSPLQRCRETADILGCNHAGAGPVSIESRLAEMSFGEWEGRSLQELRATHGPAMADWEAMGLDFRAPGGESPRDVQARIAPWLREIAAADGHRLAITHKGVIRALYAQASGWNMLGNPPTKLRYDALHRFVVDDTGIRIERLNIPLMACEAASETT